MSPRVDNNYNRSNSAYKPNDNGSNSNAPEGKSSLTSSNIGKMLSNFGSNSSGSNSSSGGSLLSSNIQKASMALGKLAGGAISGAVTTLKDVFANSKKTVGNKVNYEINAFTQGYKGNCAALASIQAVGARADAEQILRDTIHPVIKDGKEVGYKITFKGAQKGTPGSKEKPIYVSNAEANNDATKRRWGKSDKDVAVLATAIEKKLGRPPYQIRRPLSLLTGEQVKAVSGATLDKMLNNNRNVAAVGHWANHAWAVLKSAGGRLTTKNPHDTSHNEQKSAGNAYQLWVTIPKKKRQA